MRAMHYNFFGCAIALALTAGCSDPPEDPPKEETDADADADGDSDADSDADTDADVYDRYAQDTANARVRLTHHVPDGPGIDIVLGAGPAPLVEDVPFPGTLPYTPFPPGTYDIHINSTGTTDDLIFLEQTAADAATYYTILLYGSVGAAALDASLGPDALILVDDTTAPAAGSARIRPANIAFTTAAVTVWDGDTEVWDLAYGVAGDAVEIAAGAHVWGVDYTGDDVTDVEFSFEVADGDTFNAYFFAGNTAASPPEPAVGAMMLHPTTSPAPDAEDTFFDENAAMQVIPVAATPVTSE